MSEIDPAAVTAEHEPLSLDDRYCSVDWCRAHWPCEPNRLASALIAEQAKTARVAELAHRFELVPRARLLGALTARPKTAPDAPARVAAARALVRLNEIDGLPTEPEYQALADQPDS